jgi:hypothetical protein
MEMVGAIEVADRVLEEPTLTPRPTREDLRGLTGHPDRVTTDAGSQVTGGQPSPTT